jgi:predicted membrane channel-forming protein YqfA (hemolysin III family)
MRKQRSVEINTLNLPSFLWLWRIAAWSMGLSLLAYLILAGTGAWMMVARRVKQPRPNWLRPFHYIVGGTLVVMVLLLLAIGLVGTLGYYGSLGHSAHLAAGLGVVGLTLLSAWSATQISPQRSWARSLHVSTNLVLLLGFTIVSLTGWTVVQKYLP